jgi:outer membrane protein assembly factor BamB
MSQSNKKLYLGIKGSVVCLEQKTGEVIWSKHLKSSSAITNIYIEDNFIFAYSGGHLFCLTTDKGDIVWENKLKGMGYGSCIIASDSQAASVIAANQAQAASAGAVAASVAATSVAT